MMTNSDAKKIIQSDEAIQAVRLVCEAYSNVLKSHYENDAYEEPGAIDPQIALWRVLEQLPEPLAQCMKSMQLQ